MSRWSTFVAGLLLGALLTAAGAYLYFRDFYTLMVHSPYLEAASQARLDIAVLRHLKAQDLHAATILMDSRLKLNEATLSGYSVAFPSDEQDEVVAAGIRDVQQFRKE